MWVERSHPEVSFEIIEFFVFFMHYRAQSALVVYTFSLINVRIEEASKFFNLMECVVRHHHHLDFYNNV